MFIVKKIIFLIYHQCNVGIKLVLKKKKEMKDKAMLYTSPSLLTKFLATPIAIIIIGLLLYCYYYFFIRTTGRYDAYV